MMLEEQQRLEDRGGGGGSLNLKTLRKPVDPEP